MKETELLNENELTKSKENRPLDYSGNEKNIKNRIN